ncbi:MAG: uroporphyrinogen-III synthase [Gemmatimonadota bacterium]|nr:uroporphyrinogen-III synthase [Gemmatimonadota bacterium]
MQRMAKRFSRRDLLETSALNGKRIVVTRTREQSRGLVERLTELGAEVIVCPAIAIAPPDSFAALDTAIRNLARYHWIIFTSANAVRAFSERFALIAQPADALSRLRMAAVGSATANTLTELLRNPDVTPDLYQADAILPLMGNVRAQHILIPSADIARDALAKGLRERGATVDSVITYRTVAAPEISELAETVRSCSVNAIVFASPSSVRYALRALDDIGITPASLSRRSSRPAFICIGDVTAAAARELGLTVDATAAEHTTEGLVAAITDWFESRDENVAT